MGAGVPRLIAVLIAAGADHENTTTEGPVYDHTFPANFWTPGKVVRATLGAIVSDNNSTDTLTMLVRVGATAAGGTAVATSAGVDAADGDVHMAIVEITCRSVGATGVLAVVVTMNDPDATGTINMKGYGPVLVTVDTTAATHLGYMADWSVAHADNEVACEYATVWEAA
jgi:hypothetical protein